MALNRGRRGFGWFVLSLFISPIIVFIILLTLGQTEAKKLEQVEKEENIRKKLQGNSDGLPQENRNNISFISFSDELEKLDNLKNKKIISEEEFSKLKYKLINSGNVQVNYQSSNYAKNEEFTVCQNELLEVKEKFDTNIITEKNTKFPVNSHVIEIKTEKQYRVVEIDIENNNYICSLGGIYFKKFHEHEIILFSDYQNHKKYMP